MIGYGPTMLIYSPSGEMSYLTLSGLNVFTQQPFYYLINQARHLCQVRDLLMVTAISLARRRGDGLSPGSHTDFISHSTGQLCVRDKLTRRE